MRRAGPTRSSSCSRSWTRWCRSFPARRRSSGRRRGSLGRPQPGADHSRCGGGSVHRRQPHVPDRPPLRRRGNRALLQRREGAAPDGLGRGAAPRTRRRADHRRSRHPRRAHRGRAQPGTLGYRWRRFIAFDAVATLAWATYSALLGYYGGKTFESFWGLVLALTTAFAIAGGIELVRWALRRRRKRGS